MIFWRHWRRFAGSRTGRGSGEVAALDRRRASSGRQSLQATEPHPAVQEELEQLREGCCGSCSTVSLRTGEFAKRASLALLGGWPLGQTGEGNRFRTIRPRAAGCLLPETYLDDWIFAPDHALPLLENHFGVLSLEGFGLAGRTAAASAAGAILYYVRSTQRGSLDHVDRIGWYERQSCLVLDAVTVRNLELIEPLFAGTDAGVTLFRSLDAAVTPMGKRLLRAWLLTSSIL